MPETVNAKLKSSQLLRLNKALARNRPYGGKGKQKMQGHMLQKRLDLR